MSYHQHTVLIVEDEPDIANLLQINLENAGYRTLLATDGLQALNLADRHQVDLILLDLMLPKIDGLDVCRRIRSSEHGQGILIIMLTAKDKEVDKIVGFELGADDYVVKPFSIRELLLRIKALLRRKLLPIPEDKIWECKEMKVDFAAMDLWIEGKPVSLTSTEFRLLKTMIKSGNRVLTRDSLLNRVWGYDFPGYARTVDTHVRRLRVKLGPYASWIKTVRGIGYKFQPEGQDIEMKGL